VSLIGEEDMNQDRTLYPITFVGAGPGDPELITVKGRNTLENADFVIYAGSLVPKALLTWTRTGCRNVSSASMHLDEIISAIETAYRDGLKVVRLHTGDPSLYGAVFEQMSALKERGIPYQIIPGVTAAFAAAAAMGIEYTLPKVSQTLILTRMAGRTPVPEREDLADLAAHQTSMAIYLSVHLVDEMADTLAQAYGEDAPCAIVYRVSHPEERIVWTTIGRLPQAVKKEKINRQALVIVGEVLKAGRSIAVEQSKLYDKNFSHGYRK
jgi:precorrin-4/cobalt-precorrin-4 C11-methyltransferase